MRRLVPYSVVVKAKDRLAKAVAATGVECNRANFYRASRDLGNALAKRQKRGNASRIARRAQKRKNASKVEKEPRNAGEQPELVVPGRALFENKRTDLMAARRKAFPCAEFLSRQRIVVRCPVRALKD